MTEIPSLEFKDEKYGVVMVYWEYRQKRNTYEWTVFMKMPVHLYDFVSHTPAGKHTTYYSDGRVEEGYHEESTGTQVYKNPRNWRLDFERDEIPTPESVVQAIDDDLTDCIENFDGVVHFEKIIGVK